MDEDDDDPIERRNSTGCLGLCLVAASPREALGARAEDLPRSVISAVMPGRRRRGVEEEAVPEGLDALDFVDRVMEAGGDGLLLAPVPKAPPLCFRSPASPIAKIAYRERDTLCSWVKDR